MKLIKELVTLVEDRVGDARLSVNAVSLSDAVELLHDNCSHAMSIFSHDTAIFRGDRMNDSAGKMCSIISTAGSKRKSVGPHGNYYTEILDNIPSMKDFPKRSSSLICTTDPKYAEEFGELRVIVPFDNAEIGILPDDDIWNMAIDLFPGIFNYMPFVEITRFFSLMKVPDNWESIKKFCSLLESGDEKAKDLFLNAIEATCCTKKNQPEKLEAYELVMKEGLLNLFDEALSPDKTKMKLTTGANFSKGDLKAISNEVWIGGTVIAIPVDDYDDLMELMHEAD